MENDTTDDIIRRIESKEICLIDAEGSVYPTLQGSVGIAATLISRRDTKDGGRILRDTEELIEDYKLYAVKHDCWFDGKVVAQGKKELKAGSQSHVYLGDEDRTIYKLTSARDNFEETTMADIVDGIAYFNDCFPETAYELIGFGKRIDGAFCFVTKQPFVQGYTLSAISNKEHDNDEKWTNEECDKAMHTMGFEKQGRAWTDGKYFIHDICGENVMLGSNGMYYVIDADVYKIQGGINTELTLKDVEN